MQIGMRLPRTDSPWTRAAVDSLKGQTTRFRVGDEVHDATIVDARRLDPYTVEVTLDIPGISDAAREVIEG